jgi:hypothetical protein
MNDQMSMSCRDATKRGQEQSKCLLGLDRSRVCKAIRESLPRQQLHHETIAARVAEDVEDGHDIGMVDAACGQSLKAKTLPRSIVIRQRLQEHLQSHRFACALVHRGPNCTHPANSN